MQRRPDVLWRVAPGFVVLSTPRGELLTITGPGADVWDMLRSTMDEDTIITALSDRYGVAPETVRADLEPLFASLVDGHYVDTDG